MKLGHDFGRTPFGFHQVLARARAQRRAGAEFGNATAGETGRKIILEIRPNQAVATAQEDIPAGSTIEIDHRTGQARRARSAA